MFSIKKNVANDTNESITRKFPDSSRDCFDKQVKPLITVNIFPWQIQILGVY